MTAKDNLDGPGERPEYDREYEREHDDRRAPEKKNLVALLGIPSAVGATIAVLSWFFVTPQALAATKKELSQETAVIATTTQSLHTRVSILEEARKDNKEWQAKIEAKVDNLPAATAARIAAQLRKEQ